MFDQSILTTLANSAFTAPTGEKSVEFHAGYNIAKQRFGFMFQTDLAGHSDADMAHLFQKADMELALKPRNLWAFMTDEMLAGADAYKEQCKGAHEQLAPKIKALRVLSQA